MNSFALNSCYPSFPYTSENNAILTSQETTILKDQIDRLINLELSNAGQSQREIEFIQWQRVMNKISSAYSKALSNHHKAISRQNDRDFIKHRTYTYAICSSLLLAGIGPASVIMNAIFLSSHIGPSSSLTFQEEVLFQRGFGDLVSYPARKVLIEPKVNQLIHNNLDRTALKPSDSEENVHERLQDGLLVFRMVIEEKLKLILSEVEDLDALTQQLHKEKGLTGKALINAVVQRIQS